MQEIEKGLPSSIYMFYSENPYLLGESVPAIRKLISEDSLDFNFILFDLDSPEGTSTPEEIMYSLKTMSLCGGRKYVIAKNIQKLPGKEFKKFLPYLKNPSPDASFIMLYAGSIKADIKEILKGIKTICLDIREQELPMWIKEKIGQKGLSIKNNAIDYLIGILGPDIGIISSEIEKLSLCEGSEITIENIKEIVEGNRDYSVFDLTGALKEKNSEKVFKIYKTLSESFESYSLLGAINWQYKKMFTYAKDKTSKDYYYKALELLNTADIQIKTSGGSFPMEYLFARLLQL
ncbi:MAG: DNA polymerase III subunit delta [Nitrospiraceae bacterium]|nr:DNA polymerase III subunit delta [Nitrospiraceae bacterium]